MTGIESITLAGQYAELLRLSIAVAKAERIAAKRMLKQLERDHRIGEALS